MFPASPQWLFTWWKEGRGCRFPVPSLFSPFLPSGSCQSGRAGRPLPCAPELCAQSEFNRNGNEEGGTFGFGNGFHSELKALPFTLSNVKPF